MASTRIDMNRRDLFRLSAAVGLTATLSDPACADAAPPAGSTLHPPAAGPIPVAFLMADGAVMIDFAGPWEVFSNVMLPGRDAQPVFALYTVAASKAPVKASGGMTIVPDHTPATAPAPKVIVIPALGDPDPALLDWVRNASAGADLTMSVCTGAFVLAKTGLLDGKAATTHHGAYTEFAMAFPNVALQRGARYVEAGKFASAGGLSSGIDLALRVVERYFGRAVARTTATTLEYQGQGWLDPASNRAFAQRPRSTDAHPLCPVCDMEIDKASAPSSTYRRRTVYFCMDAHKKLFDAQPARFMGT
jgi:transcriptional regulator GlxA family with amidase domain/YHS domain-containing protein